MSPVSQLPSAKPSKGTLVLVGGSVRAAAQDAARSGWQIVAVDHFGDWDLTQICRHWFDYNDSRWPEQIAKVPAHFLVGVGGFERTGRVKAFCDQQNLPIAYSSTATIRSIHEPAQLSRLAAEAGIHFPETWQRADNGSSLERIAGTEAEPMDSSSKYLLKPTHHAGGIGVRFAAEPFVVPPADWLQRYCPGTPIGASYLACPLDVAGQLDQGPTKPFTTQTYLLGVCQSLLDARHPSEPFAYHGSVGPLSLPIEAQQLLERVGQLASERFGLLGLFNIDFVWNESQWVLLEINPRYSASMELLCGQQSASATEPWSLIDWHVRAFQRDPSLNDELKCCLQPAQSIPRSLGCKRIVYAMADGMFDLQSAQNALHRVTQKFVPDYPQLALTLADIPAAHTASKLKIEVGQPICTVLILGVADAHSVILLADYAANQLQASLKTL